MLIVYVPSPASEDLIVAVIYRVPNPRVSSLHTFLHRLQTIMVAARDAGGPIDVIMGDFIVDLLASAAAQDAGHQAVPLRHHLEAFMRDAGYTLVPCTDHGSLLDHQWIRSTSSLCHCTMRPGVSEAVWSDHGNV